MDKSWRASNPNHKQSTQVGGGQGTASETPQPHHCPRLGWLAVAARAQRAPEPFCLNHHFAFAQSCRGRAQRHSAINGSPRAAPLMTLSSPNTLEPGDSSSSLSPSLPPLKITVALQSRLRGEREEAGLVEMGRQQQVGGARWRGAATAWWWVAAVVLGHLLSCARAGLLETNPGLAYNFYQKSCPSLESIVRSVTWAQVAANPALPARLLRLHFHDCFVQVRPLPFRLCALVLTSQ